MTPSPMEDDSANRATEGPGRPAQDLLRRGVLELGCHDRGLRLPVHAASTSPGPDSFPRVAGWRVQQAAEQ